jgi:hypothetical protein
MSIIEIESPSDISKEIVQEAIENAIKICSDDYFTQKLTEIYQQLYLKALNEVHHVFNLPQPPIDHSHIINAWNRDIPATTSSPDKLNSPDFTITLSD